MGEGDGQVWTAQVSAPNAAHHQRAPREQPDRDALLFEEVSVMVGGVARSGDRDQRSRGAERDPVAVLHRVVGRREVRRGRCHEGGAVSHNDPRAPRDVVGVRVRVDCPHDPQVFPGGEELVGSWKARWVDQRSGPVAEIDQIRGVAQALVYELVDLDHEISKGVSPSRGSKSPSCSGERDSKDDLNVNGRT